MIQIIDCEQGSLEWIEARRGLATASEFATIMRKKGKAEDGSSKERRMLLDKLAGEIVTGDPMWTFQNDHMERGKIMEDEARKAYQFINDAPIQRVGFIRNGDKGCSPDSLIGDNGGLEIKTALAHIQIDRLRRDVVPPEHVAQVQGNLWVAEREFWDFVSYCPKLPLFEKRVYRDEKYIKELESAVAQFNEELAQLVEWVRRYGQRSAA